MKKSIKIFLVSLILFLISPIAADWALAEATPTLLFDSSNHYLGGCQLTDKSEWTLERDLPVTLFQIWYNWEPNETELDFTLTKDGEEFLTGTATRTTCDTYQKNWCNADFVVNQTFPAGTYATKVAKVRQCLVPNGTGVVRLYGIAAEEPVVEQTEKIATPEGEPTACPKIPSCPPANCQCPKVSSLPLLG